MQNVDESKNSDALQMQIELEGKKQTVAGTNTLTIENANLI